MGKTYLYNTGEAKEEKEKLQLQFCMFFDGTGNNRTNTTIRLNVENKEILTNKEYEGLAAPEKRAEMQKTLTEKGHARKITSLWLKNEMEDSYANDFSNVARLSFVTIPDRSIYIEGIGTAEREHDSDEGYALGSGATGVRGKVRKGCEDLVKKISIDLKSARSTTKKISQLTLDVFGFSRGSAAARNFLYEINYSSKKPEDIAVTKTQRIIGYRAPSFGSDMAIPIYEDYLADCDQKEVDPAFLENGKMPRFGYLGYCLRSMDVLSKEELKSLSLVIRFVGVFDTVASYDEGHDSMVAMGVNAGKSYIKSKLGKGFGSGLDTLHLNNVGPCIKAVHLTAMDEHRMNFALTRFPGAIEKNLPGVHSDIGGSYTNLLGKDNEEVGLDTVPLATLGSLDVVKFKIIKQTLKDQYWYKEEHFGHKIKLASIPTALLLTGKRNIHKEYSFIPLHFMERFYRSTLTDVDEKIMIPNNQSANPDGTISLLTENRFSIDSHDVLIQTKNRLEKYVFEDGKPLVFKSDQELEKIRREKNKQKLLEEQLKRDMEETWRPHTSRAVQDNLSIRKWTIEPREPQVLQPVPPPKPTWEQLADMGPIHDIPEVIIYSEQRLLRKLRLSYLHWSSNYDKLGMQPTFDWKRKEY